MVIYELRNTGSYRVTRWLISGAGEMLPPKYYRTKKEADKAKSEAISHAKIKKVDVLDWGTRRGTPISLEDLSTAEITESRSCPSGSFKRSRADD